MVASLLPAAVRYPIWFLYQGRYPEMTVGYTLKGTEAIVDAQIRYVVYTETLYHGSSIRYQDYDESLKDYYYDYDPAEVEKIKGRLKPLATFAVNLISNDFITAFAPEIPESLATDFISIYDIPRPEWTQRGPMYRDGDDYFGVGMYTYQANENDAWQTAEDKAVYNIITAAEIRVRNVVINEKSERGENIEKASKITFKYRIRNIRVMERWRDPDNSMVYTLVRIHSSDLKNLLE